MRYPAGHKEQTRAKILRAAARVFRREGYHAAGVDEVMKEAGLTAGGFYAHFPSKEALLAEALAPAAAEAGAGLEKDLEGLEGPARLRAFVEHYLSTIHLRRMETGCPLPALASEVARAAGPAKASFEDLVREGAARLRGDATDEVGEDRALAVLALCVGSLGLARSVRDPAFAGRILAAGRDLATAFLGDVEGGPSPTARTRKRRPS